MSEKYFKLLLCIVVLHLCLFFIFDRALAGDCVHRSNTRGIVAFRLDDILDYRLTDTQQYLIKLFKEERIKLTIAVIGGYIGLDEPLIGVIKSAGNLISLANHGLHRVNDVDGKSILLTQPINTSKYEIEKANRNIKSVFGRKPIIFVPHQNEYNEKLMQIISDLEFSHLSAGFWQNGVNVCLPRLSYSHEQSICGLPDKYGVIHAPAGASTQWEPMAGKNMAKVAEVIQEVDNSVKKYGFAVIMLHPQDFVDAKENFLPERLEQLRALLKEVKSKIQKYQIGALEQIRFCQ